MISSAIFLVVTLVIGFILLIFTKEELKRSEQSEVSEDPKNKSFNKG